MVVGIYCRGQSITNNIEKPKFHTINFGHKNYRITIGMDITGRIACNPPTHTYEHVFIQHSKSGMDRKLPQKYQLRQEESCRY